MLLDRPRMTRIEEVHWETDRHATIALRDGPLATCAAGAFAMLWVPGVDEVPMGVGPTDGQGRATFTVEAKGDCTRAMVGLPEGARLGVRGPYGQGFRLPPEPARVCFVGGGTGIAPMARGAQQAATLGHDVTVVSGARSKDLLLLHGHLLAQDAAGRLRYHPCTDDGGHGFHGFTTARLAEMLAEDADFAYVAACGPEPMMVRVTRMCQETGTPSEASLERYMKCATGICDACTVGDGQRVCVEGPVFRAEALEAMPEYGTGHRDACGVLRPL